MTNLGNTSLMILEDLRAVVEHTTHDIATGETWGDVYLKDVIDGEGAAYRAKLNNLSRRSIANHLGKLAEAGLYKHVDGVYGEVLMSNDA